MAEQLIGGNISCSDIQEINKTLKKKSAKNPPDAKNIEKKVVQLQKIIAGRRADLKKAVCIKSLQENIDFLSRACENNCVESIGLEICENLIELARTSIEISFIHESGLQEYLRKIGELCMKSSFQVVKDIGKAVNLLENHWKNVERNGNCSEENDIADESLRKLVCRKIAMVLKNNQFDDKSTREIALSIEGKIRKMDPSMSHKYKKCYRQMIQEIKQITPSVYNEITLLSL